jgi:hypothetical protein
LNELALSIFVGFAALAWGQSQAQLQNNSMWRKDGTLSVRAETISSVSHDQRTKLQERLDDLRKRLAATGHGPERPDIKSLRAEIDQAEPC